MLSLFSGLVQTGREINVIGEVYLARECAKAECEGSVSKARLVGVVIYGSFSLLSQSTQETEISIVIHKSFY